MGSEAEAATKAAGFAKDDGAGAEAEDEDGDENSEEAAAKGGTYPAGAGCMRNFSHPRTAPRIRILNPSALPR